MVHPSAHQFSTFPLLPSAYPGLVPSGCWNETLSDPGIELGSPTLQADSLPSEPPGTAAAKSPQSCPTLCDPIDGSPPGSLVPGILQVESPLEEV